ncbi:hypothetical protein C7H84_35675 [Burkholderia sp. Nafp2/4-1b]|uniref:Ig-like domain-containing protein n=1 Tax=Burkholderia sp. Nafp2/4-1b TaxID=2116686 RepID=UPI000EF964E7|nr:Ig-like domain-containing protein [Burkholderia sp. Nafp2/4-1b]RKT98696.1 hypothetical protein C7H84_35675 [Burkholderia sp. Nafp2/4-1b]
MSVLVRWRNALALIFPLFFVGLLASCGGGDDGGVVGTPTVKSISLVTSTNQISSGDTNNSAKLTATVTGSNGRPMRNVFVKFNPGGNTVVLPGVDVATDSNGVATATFTYGSDKTNRTVTVTATAGPVASNSVSIGIVGTTISLSVPTGVQQGDSATVVTTVLDASGNAVENMPVTLASALGNAIAPPSQTTESDGTAAFGITPSTAGTDTLTASINGAKASDSLTVAAAPTTTISLASSQPSIRSGANALTNQTTITATALSNGAPVVGVLVSFSVDSGAIISQQATTNSNGVATAVIGYGADKSNRRITVTAIANGTTVTTPVQVEGTSISIEAWPLEAPKNSTPAYTALLKDADGTPIGDAPLSVLVAPGVTQASAQQTANTGTDGSLPFTISAGGSAGQFGIVLIYGKQTERFLASIGDPFTKIDADGHPLPFTATSWVAVRDNVTTVDSGQHLWWEIKTDGGPRDTNSTYTLDAAKSFATTINGSGGLAGAADWRLPSVGSGEDYDALLKTFSAQGGWQNLQQWLPLTQQTYYRTSAPINDSGVGKFVDITYGAAGDVILAVDDNPQPVRLVRTGQ